MLSVRDLTVAFGNNVALDCFSLHVERGHIHGLIGPNGSGKTTCFNAVTGLVPPRRGSILIDGAEAVGLKPFEITRRGVARTFQRPSVMPGLSCLDNVMLGMHWHTETNVLGTYFHAPFVRSAQDRRMRMSAAETLEFVGLGGFEGRPAGELTWVEEQLLQIGRALAARPRLLLLDEPTAGMGSAETQCVDQLVRRVRESGVTILVIAHDVGLVMGISDVVTVINQGSRIAKGSPSAVQSDPAVVEAYLGAG